jgi:hypothetical protein
MIRITPVSLRNPLFVICLILSVLCLAVGYGMVGNWVGAVLASLMGPAWWFARKYPTAWLPFFCLLISVGLAAAGSLIGAPPLLMMVGAAVTLAVWDLVLLEPAVGNHSSAAQARHYEHKHLQSLMLALSCGLLAAWLGRSLSIQVPFPVLMLLIAFLLFALDRVWGYIRRTGKA